MKDRSGHNHISTGRLLVLTIVLVFLAEVVLAYVFYRLPTVPHGWDELLDGIFLTVLLSPALYIVLIRPLIDQIHQREAAENKLQAVQQDLEMRVDDRTAELALANALLEEEVGYHRQIRDVLENERSELESRVEERTLELRHEVILHKQAGDRLKLQTTALEAAANGVIITNRKGEIEWANQAFFEMTGYVAEEVLGKTPRLTKSGLYGKQFYNHFWSTILSGQVWQGELANRRKDGSLYIEEQTVAPVLDEDGAVTHFIAIKQDISDRKAAEEVIRADAARAKIRTGIDEAISKASPDFHTVLAVTARRMADLIGDMCFIHLLEEPGENITLAAFHQSEAFQQISEINNLASIAGTLGVDLVSHALRTGQPLVYPSVKANRLDANLLNSLQELLDANSTLVIPLHTQGRTIGALSLFRQCANPPYTSADQAIVEDLAERIALAIAHARLYQDLESALNQEQTMRAQLVQTEKFAAIGRMVASVAHELNNPLQTIKNCLYLIEQDVPTPASREFLGLASSEIQRLGELVDQLREVYRPRSTNQMRPCDLVKLLEEVHLLMNPHLQRNRVHWETGQMTEPVMVNGIANQIKQVFLNISLNAIEAMQPDGGAIRVALQRAPDGSQVGLSFQDTGPGIAPEQFSHMFEPLVTTKEKGLGLGLSISFDVVQKHGGQIIVDSPPGEGATFTVWLPVLTADAVESN